MEAGFVELAALVSRSAATPGDPTVEASLVAALTGEPRGTSVMFDSMAGDERWTDAFGWLDPGPAGAWLVRNSVLPGRDAGSGELILQHAGRARLEDELARAFGRLLTS